MAGVESGAGVGAMGAGVATTGATMAGDFNFSSISTSTEPGSAVDSTAGRDCEGGGGAMSLSMGFRSCCAAATVAGGAI